MSVNLKSLLTSIIKQVQYLEFVFNDIENGTTLNAAIGIQLDGIGDLVGLPRFTDDDDAYRAAIRFQISLNNSYGTPEDIIGFLKQQTNATSIQYQESYPAKVVINIEALISDIPGDILAQTERIAPAGVQIQITQSEPGQIFFGFDPEGGVQPLVSGFSEPNYVLDAGLGGQLSEKFS